jgi:RimJ/RimL family protein N-acetyltransferase
MTATPALPPSLSSPRLLLRPLRDDAADAHYLCRLLNQPGFLRHIGDRGVRCEGDVSSYLQHGPLASYREHGFGLMAIERHSDGAWLGMAGLLRRPSLPGVDIGYALLAEHAGHGYAREAAAMLLRHAADALHLATVYAIVAMDNTRSLALLDKLGFVADGTTCLPGSEQVLQQLRWRMPSA